MEGGRELRDPTVRSGLRELLETLDNTVDELCGHIDRGEGFGER